MNNNNYFYTAVFFPKETTKPYQFSIYSQEAVSPRRIRYYNCTEEELDMLIDMAKIMGLHSFADTRKGTEEYPILPAK